MLRALAASVAMLVVSCGLEAAEPPRRHDSPAASHSRISSAQPAPHSNPAAEDSLQEDSAAEIELLQAANRSRNLAGVPPLRIDQSLSDAARAHARRMITENRLEHQLAGEPGLLQRISLVSDLPLDRAGENLASASCAESAHEALMRSTPHRQNLLDRRFNVAGIVAMWSHGKLYVVQDFGHEIVSYSASEAGRLVARTISETRQQAGLSALAQVAPADLDQAACSLAHEDHPSARLLATAYTNRKIITYTQSHPEILPPSALRLLSGTDLHRYAVGACYARNAAYPTGMYWVAILLD